MRAGTVCLGLLPFLLSAIAPAQEYSHRVYRTEDGLPHNRVQALTQTLDGYLWIGTSEGLARFDGARFVVFDRSNTPTLADNSILSLLPSPDGSLWIGTEGGGLLHYANGAFRAFGERDGITNGFVRAMRLDHAGTLWVGTDRGFFRFGNNHFTRLDNTSDIPLASVVAIAEDSAGKIWVASSAGLLVVENGVLVRTHCGTTAVAARIAVWLLREKLAGDVCHVPEIPVPDVAVDSLLADGSGNLWIGTLGRGLLKVQRGVITSYKAPAVLPEDTVFAIFEDRQKNMWAGSLDGLVRLSPTSVATITARDGLMDDNVSTTYEDHEGRLWITTYSGQVYRFRGEVPERYYLPAPARDLRVRTVFEDKAGGYWFGTADSGLIHQTGNSVVRYTKADGLRSDNVRQLLEDPQGTLWIATNSGLSRWDGHAFRNYYLEEGLSYPNVRCLAYAADGDVLVGTDAGLNRIHDGRIVPDPVFAELRQDRIWAILPDPDGFWVGTRGSGLVRVKDGKLTRFTVHDGLASNSIYQIVDDRNGRLWMSSPGGVFSVRRDELNRPADGSPWMIHSVTYGTPEGMETSQMSGGLQPAGCRRSSGALWFASVRGAVKIDPAQSQQHKLAPVFIEKVTAGETTFPLSREVVIPPGHGKVQIDYTACNLVGPEGLSFRYRLEGLDEFWTPGSKQRTAFYSAVSPGHYRFRVTAADSVAPDDVSEASVAIYIQPSFYQTAWFYTLCTAVLIGIASTGLWLYTRQTKARFALLLNERSRLAREMHDTVIQGCIGVSALLEAAARCQRSNLEEAGELLDHARSQVKATIEEAREAVWNLRQSSRDGAAVSSLFDLARKLGTEHGAKVDTALEGAGAPLDPETGQVLLLVGREALRNAVMHGHPARISVRIVFDAGRVRMQITDDGKGFDTNGVGPEAQGHFGIVGMRERVEQLGGEFLVNSKPGEGTSVVASMPRTRRG